MTTTCFATLGLVAVSLAPVVAQTAVKPSIETVATLAAPGAIENIAEGPDGALYLTGRIERILWKVTPDGRTSKFHESATLANFVGVATGEDEVVLGAFQRSIYTDRQNVGSRMLILDRAGQLKATVDAPRPSILLNGLATMGDGQYLATDANGTTIWRLSTADRTLEPWITDELLIRPNGLKVHDGWAYVATRDAGGNGHLYRIQIDNGKPKGKPVLWGKGVSTDDFAIAPDGTIYAPTMNMGMVRVSPTGQVSTFLENVAYTTSAWVTRDGKWLYWPTPPDQSGNIQVQRVALR